MLNFELLPNWKDVAKKAWSMWGNYITMILAGMETVSVVFLNGEPSLTVTLAVFAVIAASTGARLVSQTGLSKRAVRDDNGGLTQW
jgi:threonine/homoserine efflux transporter RhtA